MPLIYTKEEIKAYLFERGFDIQDDVTINNFIRDLKKMVKFEDRARRRQLLGHDPQETNLDSSGQSGGGPSVRNPEISHQKSRTIITDDDKAGPSTKGAHPHISRVRSSHSPTALIDETDSKKKKTHRPKTARDSSQKENIPHRSDYNNRVESLIPVAPSSGRIVMTRKTFKQQNGDALVEESFVHIGESGKPKKSRPKTARGNVNSHSIVESKEVLSTFQNRKSIFDSKSRTVGNQQGTTTTTSKSGSRVFKNSKSNPIDTQDTDELIYILGNLLGECDDENDDTETVATTKTIKGPPDSVKRDPVALYHYYKGIWSKQNIPGESRHMQLRWNVRAQTVGTYPCVNGQPVKYLR